MRVFILDDEKMRQRAFERRFKDHEIVRAWNFWEALPLLWSHAAFDLAFLDHDLASAFARSRPDDAPGWEMTGADVATFMAALPVDKRPRRIVVHSWNRSGADRMVRVLRAAGYPRVEYEAFDPPLLERRWEDG